MEDTTPIEAQSQQDYLTSKEVAALLLSGLSKSNSHQQQTPPKPTNSETNGTTGPKESTSSQNSTALRKHESNEHLETSSVSSQNTATELRPHRKAPPPPSSLRTSAAMSEAASDGGFGLQQDGTLRRPARRAPAPPSARQNARVKVNGTREKVGVSNPESKLPEKHVLYIGGKRPKLQKITPDRLEEKHLNPMIRPSTRGFMPRPIDRSRDIWESRPEKRLLESKHHKSNDRNRDSSNLGSNAASSVHGWSPAGPGSDITCQASGQPSPVSRSNLMSDRLLQSLTGQNTPTGVGLSRSSSLGSVNSHATLSHQVPATVGNSSFVSDGSKATLTNIPTARSDSHDSNDHDLNGDGDDESNNGRKTPVMSSVARLTRNRSRSQSPAIFPPASPSILFHNIQRLSQPPSQYSSDASDAGSVSARPVPVRQLNVSEDHPPPPSSTRAVHQRPKSQGAYNKRRDKRHRTLTSVPPPSVPRFSETNRSFSGSAKKYIEMKSPNGDNSVEPGSADITTSLKKTLFEQDSREISEHANGHDNRAVTEDDSLEFPPPPPFDTQSKDIALSSSANDNRYGSPHQTNNHSFHPPPPADQDSEGSVSSHIAITPPPAITAEDRQTSPGSPRSPQEDVNASPLPLRHTSNVSGLGVEDFTPARNSLQNLLPGTVSGIVQQINKLAPPSSKSSGVSSSNSSQGKGSSDNLKERDISDENETAEKKANSNQVITPVVPQSITSNHYKEETAVSEESVISSGIVKLDLQGSSGLASDSGATDT